MRLIGVGLLLVLFAGACSTGVSDEVHDAAVADALAANLQVADLEASLSEAKEGLGEIDALDDQLASRADEVDRLEAELEAAVDATEAAEERHSRLTDLTYVPNTPAATLISVHTHGSLRCGIAGGIQGFSYIDEDDGTVSGFDADFCRAIAAAVLGDSDAVEFVPTAFEEQFDVLHSGWVDVLIRNTTWTLSRDAALALHADFGPTIFHDGQQFLGRTDQFTSASGAADVDGARLCTFPQDSFQEERAVEWALSVDSTFDLVQREWLGLTEALESLQSGTCDLLTTDGSILAAWRLSGIDAGTVADGELTILPSVPISREPLGPVYRQGDTVWADIVNWVVFATIIADEKGIDSTTIDSAAWDGELGVLFGTDGDLVTALGLESDALYQVIKQVGSYREIFENNLGALGIVRAGTPNAHHADGGLIFAPPAR